MEGMTELKKAGEIAREVKKYARGIVKKDILLIDLAEKIEKKIFELGGKPAFPVNLSIDEVAAHSTPAFEDDTKALGLLKIDLGVHIDGFIADTAFSVNLEDSEENEKLIEAAESALRKALEIFSSGVELRKIGTAIEKEISSFSFQPIINLSGHSIERFNLHSGTTIPNYDNLSEKKVEEGTYAIEPFATSGAGKVIDGKPSGIYSLEREGNVRDNFSRDVLNYIKEEYNGLPFCSRWICNKFGKRALIALKRIEDAGLVHHYPQLVEKSKKPVAQAEHTIVLAGKGRIITT